MDTVRKPLYLTGERNCTVHTDGVALRIFVEGRAERRLPLGRISRVVSRRDVEWTTRAMLVCVVKRVPIFFTDGYGQMLGCLLPAQSREYGLHETLGEFFDLAGGRHIYDNWFRSEKSRLWRELYRKPRAQRPNVGKGKLVDDPDFRRLIYQGKELFSLPSPVREALRASVASLLHREGVTLQYKDGDGHRVDLLEDVVRLAVFYYSLSVPFSATRTENPPNMLVLLHHHEFKITSYIRAALHRLHRLARDTIESW